MMQPGMLVRVVGPTALVSLLLLGSCAVVAFYLYEEQASSARAYGADVDIREVSHSLETTIGDLRRALRSAGHDLELARQQVDPLARRVRESIADGERLADTVEERASLDQVEASFGRFEAAWAEVVASPNSADSDRLSEVAGLVEDEALPAAVQLRDHCSQAIQRTEASHRRNTKRMIGGLAVVGTIGSFAGIFLGFSVARALRQSIHQLSVRVRDAAGKLGQDLPVVTLEEGNLHDLHKQMKSVVHEVEQVVERLQQRERELLRAEQLAAVGQLAAGVAHELRNPLTSIKMLVQKNRKQAGAAGLPTDNLQIIEQEIRRMERCLQTFLDYARPPKPDRHPTDLAALVERTFTLIEGRARNQQVALRFECDRRPVTLNGDWEQVQQLLMNLALNALDVMPRGGTLTVDLHAPSSHTDPRELSDRALVSAGPTSGPPQRATPPAVGPSPLGSAADGQIELRVRDTGPGISAALLPHLFEPFVSTKETGLGLGLVVSRRIAEAHGGSLAARNQPHGGACFVLRLPTTVPVGTPRIGANAHADPARS